MTDPRVVVLGDVMTDVLAVLTGPLEVGSDAPASVTTSPGGSGANVAAWLGSLGVPVALVGRIGDDPLGVAAVAALTACGVSAHLAVDPVRPTGTCVVLVGPDGERSMLPDAGANRALDPAELPGDLFGPGRHLHLSGYPLLHPGGQAAALAALDLAREHGMTVSVDPSSTAPLAALGTSRFLAWTAGATLCLPNEEEARLLAGLPDADAATVAQALTGHYPQVVVTRGPAGAVACRAGGTPVAVPAAPVERVVDTTGAGDAFAAGLLHDWLAGRPLDAAMATGCALAAQAVSRAGARPATPR